MYGYGMSQGYGMNQNFLMNQGYGQNAGHGIGVAIIAVSILILIALGVIF